MSDNCLFVIFMQTLETSKIQETLVSLLFVLLERKYTHNNITRVTDDLVIQLAGLKIIWRNLLMLQHTSKEQL